MDRLPQALRMRECPGIAFLDAPTGRQAVIAGTGLAVWEVVALDREVGEEQARRAYPHLFDAAEPSQP